MTAHLAHQLLHSDALAAELEALGLDSTIFGAVGVPAPVFQALLPRRAGVFDHNANTYGTGDEPGVFTRASDGCYRDHAGRWQIQSANLIRVDHSAVGAFLGYLVEPASTNKCTNYNVAIDAALSNVTKTGDAAATLARAVAGDLPDELADLCPDSYVIRLDNSGGSTAAAAEVTGAAANTNVHTFSAWAKKASGAGDVKIGNDTGTVLSAAAATTWARMSATGATAATDVFTLQVPAGCIGECVINQLEEYAFPTTPIVTAGATATRARDKVLWDILPAGIDLTKGTLVFDLSLPFSNAAFPGTVNSGIIAIRNNLFWSWAYFNILASGGDKWVGATQNGGYGTSVLIENAANTPVRIAYYWDTSANHRMMHVCNGVWTLGFPNPFVAHHSTNDLVINSGAAALPFHLKNMRIYDRALPESEIQRLFTI